MTLEVNSMSQIHWNFCQIRPGKFFVKYPWFWFERNWKNQALVSALSDVINWDYKNCKKIPVKIKKSLPPKFTLNEKDSSQAFEALQKSHMRRVVPKGKKVRDLLINKKVQIKDGRRHLFYCSI